jgi:hypothetical protein
MPTDDVLNRLKIRAGEAEIAGQRATAADLCLAANELARLATENREVRLTPRLPPLNRRRNSLAG